MILSSRHDRNSEQELPPERPEIKFFLTIPQTDAPKRLPSRLARKMGLHLYSEVLLGKSARTEMNFAAFILLIVSLFELSAWFFLFNTIFNSDLVKFGLPTIPAVLMAALFGSAVFWFERQFLTTDEDQRKRAWGAAVIRVAFILTAAFITAQPLELLFFRVPVQKRVHEEGIREEAVSKLAALLKEGEQETAAINDQSKINQASYDELQKQLQDLAAQRGSLAAQLTTKQGELAAARSESARFRDERNSADMPAGRRGAEIGYARAEALAARISGEIGQIRLGIAEADGRSPEIRDQAKEAKKELIELIKMRLASNTGRDHRLRSWIDQLKDSKPKETVEENWKIATSAHPDASGSSILDKPWPPYKDPEYDFFEQIHAVWDLVYGRPPRWLNAPPAIQTTLETQYGFASLDQGRRGWQWHLFLSVLACHLIAIFIPFLVLTIKLFLMPNALRIYYSSRHQAEAGDGDAWLARYVDESVKGR
ncbi:MAG TPA: DUF4407 domain-containing protein [Thermoanaerobaculia bacterium]|nr:DUF4407 domain-containing protein [Thermoanaerobaculia bacterium]